MALVDERATCLTNSSLKDYAWSMSMVEVSDTFCGVAEQKSSPMWPAGGGGAGGDR
jgi:hypothetical protein